MSTKATIDKEIGTGGDASRSHRAKKNKKTQQAHCGSSTSLPLFSVSGKIDMIYKIHRSDIDIRSYLNN